MHRLMVQGTSLLRHLVNAPESVGSTVRNVVEEGVHRLRTHFEEWPELYVEQQVALCGATNRPNFGIVTST